MKRQANELARTLDRGIQVLELVAASPRGLTMTEIAAALGLHRTIVHRLLRTLAAHNYVSCDVHKRYQPAVGLIHLAEAVNQDLRSVAGPLLEHLAERVGATANIAIPDGDQVIVLSIAQPRRADVHVAYRAGQSHPLDRGSAGIAILAGRPPAPRERAAITRARSLGYAVTHEEVIPGTWGVSAPFGSPGTSTEGSVGVSLFTNEDIAEIGGEVRVTASEITQRLP